MWTFAAVNSVEPVIIDREIATIKDDSLEGDKPWSQQRLPLVDDRIRGRLEPLSRWLGEADWLEGAFSVGDLMMVSVLFRLSGSGMVEEYPNLSAYLARGEARPAYKRAFAAQHMFNQSGSKEQSDDKV